MENSSQQHEVPTRSLRRLLFLRVVVATFLLGIAAFIQIKGTPLSPESIKLVFFIIVIIYLLSILYVLLQKIIPTIETNIYIQALCDVVLITILVYVTGGVESVYSVLYQLVIIYSTLFLGRRGGIIAASAGSIFYGLLLNLEFYGILKVYGIVAPST